MFFSWSDPLPTAEQSKLPTGMAITSTVSSEALLLRMNCGLCDIIYPASGKVLPLRDVLCDTHGRRQKRLKASALQVLLSPLTKNELQTYFSKSLVGTNEGYFRNLVYEISVYWHCYRRKEHTLAFLHLYRLLEVMSYSFPMLTISTKRNVYGSFKAMKEYFKSEGGELDLYKRYCGLLFAGQSVLGATVDFDVTCSTSIIAQDVYDALKKATMKVSTHDDSLRQVTVKYSDLTEMIRILRNRYFHFAIGSYQENIAAKSVHHPDELFSQVNAKCFNWLMMILFESQKLLISNVVR